jgi:hypothetical protein
MPASAKTASSAPSRSEIFHGSQRAQQLVLAGELLAQGPALEGQEPGEHELRPARGGHPPPHVEVDRPPVPVAAEEAAGVPQLDLVLPAVPRVAPRVAGVPAERGAEPEQLAETDRSRPVRFPAERPAPHEKPFSSVYT